MRHLRALVLLLVVVGAWPVSARADTGWSLESSGVLRPPPSPPESAATMMASAPGAPLGLVGADAPIAAVLAPAAGAASDDARPRAARDDPPRDHSRIVRAARSRYRAAQRGYLTHAPALARATLGIVGVHASPPPPRARA